MGKILDRSIFLALLIGLELITLPANLTNANTTTVVLKTIDEEAFQSVLFTMHQGMEALNIDQIATGAFLSYGWTFFAINALATFPAYLAQADAALVLIPRILSTASAAVSIFLLFAIAKQWLTRPQALAVASLALLFPGFYSNAFWMHPDHFVTTALLATIYCFIKDQCTFKKYFIAGLMCIGFGLTVKLTAIMYLLIPALYIGYGTLWHTRHAAILLLKRSIATGSIVVSTFILFNPAIFYPQRIFRIIDSLYDSILDNKTNHGGDAAVTTFTNIIHQAIEQFYMPAPLVLLVLSLFGLGIYYELRHRPTRPIIILSGSWFILFLVYNVTQVNKLWEHYYLPVFMVAPLALIALYYWRWTRQYWWWCVIPIVLLQCIFQLPKIVTVFANNLSLDFNRDYNNTINVPHERAVTERAVQILNQHNIKPSGVLTSPWLPFPKTQYHLTYDTFHRIYGYLSDDVLALSDYPDIIIIDKAENYFKAPDDPTITNLASYSAILQGQSYIQKLQTNYTISTATQLIQYEVLANDDLVLIFEKKTYGQ